MSATKTGASILLVDQSRVNLMLQETVLRRKESLVEAVTSGSVALMKIRENAPDLVIFGFDLSDMSGPDFCRSVRADEQLRGVSLLFISDRNAGEQADLCLAAGCNDILYRPFHRRDLDAVVEKLITIPVRRDLRTLTKLEVQLHNEDFFLLGHSVNISSNGMLVQVDHLLPPEAKVRINFYLPGDLLPLNLMAEVVRAEFSGKTARYGLRFLDPTPDQQSRIEAYVTKMQARSLH